MFLRSIQPHHNLQHLFIRNECRASFLKGCSTIKYVDANRIWHTYFKLTGIDEMRANNEPMEFRH